MFTHTVTDRAAQTRSSLITCNTNITHLSDTPTPPAGVRCRRYVVRGSHLREQKQRQEFQGKRYENDPLAEST